MNELRATIEQWEMFDQLPWSIRQAMNEAAAPLKVEPVLAIYRERGEAVTLAQIERWNDQILAMERCERANLQ